jgi:hypothetical protein
MPSIFVNKKNTGVQEFRSSGVQDFPEAWTNWR